MSVVQQACPLLGASGSLAIWASLQPFLAIGSLMLLAGALLVHLWQQRVKVRQLRSSSCVDTGNRASTFLVRRWQPDQDTPLGYVS